MGISGLMIILQRAGRWEDDVAMSGTSEGGRRNGRMSLKAGKGRRETGRVRSCLGKGKNHMYVERVKVGVSFSWKLESRKLHAKHELMRRNFDLLSARFLLPENTSAAMRQASTGHRYHNLLGTLLAINCPSGERPKASIPPFSRVTGSHMQLIYLNSQQYLLTAVLLHFHFRLGQGLDLS